MRKRQHNHRQYRSFIPSLSLLVLLGFIWGSGYSLARFATTHGVAPLGYAFWQTLGPVLVLTLWAQCQREAWLFERKTLLFYAVTGLLGIAIPNAILYFSSALLPAGLLSVVMNVTPVFTYALALMMATERFNGLKVCGVLICVVGLMVLVMLRSPIDYDQFKVQWIGLALISPLCFSLTAVYITKYRPDNTSSLVLARGMLVSAFLFITPVVAITHSFYYFSHPWQARDTVIVLEMILSSVGYIILFQLLQRAGAVYYSLVSGIVALTGIFWGRLIFGEQYNEGTWLGIVLIMLGIGIVTLCLYCSASRSHIVSK